MIVRLSKAQQAALQLVADGRVEYGSEFPEMSRRSARRGNPSGHAWLIDGYGSYGQQGRSFSWLEEKGLIVVRRDLVPTHEVPERTRGYRSVAGLVRVSVIPAHDEPVDPGWRAAVELTQTAGGNGRV